jgi:hypothetical protein
MPRRCRRGAGVLGRGCVVSEEQLRLPLLIDTGALALGEYAVLNIDYKLVQVFDTEEEAMAFVAKANGWDIEKVRHATRERGRMLVEYRENLIRHSRERRKQ